LHAVLAAVSPVKRPAEHVLHPLFEAPVEYWSPVHDAHDVPATFAYFPAPQLIRVLDPSQEFPEGQALHAVFPAEPPLVYFPARHFSQTVFALPVEYCVPEPHDLHEAKPAVEYVPAPQPVLVVDPSHLYPAGHAVHAVFPAVLPVV